jgi:hypothetical protein
VLRSGSWYKLAVEKEGVFRINHDLLKKMGVNPGSIDPKKIRIYGNPGGMLPQANSASRPDDLQELSIFVSGEADGKFDKKDFIVFYASGPDRATLNPEKEIFHYEKNLYSNRNFYFLTVSEQDGRRVSETPDLPAGSGTVAEFNDCVYHEIDEHNELHSGREWYGEKFGLTNELLLKFNIPGIVAASEIKIVSDVMGQSYANASFKLFLNNSQIGEQPILPIPSGRYSSKGYDRRDTIIVNETAVGASTKDEQQIVYNFAKASGFSQGYLDYILLNFKRQLKLYGSQTIFTSAASLQNAVSTFSITNTTADVLIWDITEPADIKAHAFVPKEGTATFTTTTDYLKKFIVFDPSIGAPEFVEEIPNQNLHGLATPNLIVVTHPLFKDEATRLANHRQSNDNWSVQVVTTDEVYNEFSSGRQDVSAIRDFVKLLYDKNPNALKAILLFGKCSYDYKDRVQDNTNFVPTYESRNSLAPLQTYSSDDFFAFLEPAEGEWRESPVMMHTLDIGVGRLPVSTLAQATAVVDKIIEYDSDISARGYWRKKIAFVADDGNSEDGFTSLHQYQADALARLVEESNAGFDTKKLFMGKYVKTVKPNGETVPQMTEDIISAFEDGSLIINYTGHGSEQLWTDERVFSDQIINELENDLYPFLVNATCEFGRHDDPFQTSSAEICITRANAGAIGSVTSTRPVNSPTNFELNEAFYQALFERTSEGYSCIGEVFRKTKNNSIVGVGNRNFSLLADPSMTLALPPDVVKITSIKTENGSDTLKALSRVIIKGHIENAGGEKLTGFNGLAEATLFNKKTEFVTIGRNNPPFHFQEWNNILFRGKATVENGEFSMQFIVPKNISYSISEGKLGVYAYDPTATDANGFSTAFKIGGSESSVPQDNTPPVISLFIGDTTFVSGGVTDPDTYLVARLSDESGINISSYGIGNSIMATLDGQDNVFILNDYYVADTDNYKKGTLRYPLRDLVPGRHSITVSVWDVYNNPAQATLDFIVTDSDQLIIETLGNYPNPFIDKTTVFFTHNRSGDDLEAQLFIYSSRGELLESLLIPVSQSEYKIELLEMNNGSDTGKKLPAGLYFARLIVRSLTNGSKNEQVTKLIVLN